MVFLNVHIQFLKTFAFCHVPRSYMCNLSGSPVDDTITFLIAQIKCLCFLWRIRCKGDKTDTNWNSMDNFLKNKFLPILVIKCYAYSLYKIWKILQRKNKTGEFPSFTIQRQPVIFVSTYLLFLNLHKC